MFTKSYIICIDTITRGRFYPVAAPSPSARAWEPWNFLTTRYRSRDEAQSALAALGPSSRPTPWPDEVPRVVEEAVAAPPITADDATALFEISGVVPSRTCLVERGHGVVLHGGLLAAMLKAADIPPLTIGLRPVYHIRDTDGTRRSIDLTCIRAAVRHLGLEMDYAVGLHDGWSGNPPDGTGAAYEAGRSDGIAAAAAVLP